MKILGHRPMTKLDKVGFMDIVTGYMVNYYVDKIGREWMANNKWGWFRVKVKVKGEL